MLFRGTCPGAELDLLVVRGGRRLGFEFKRTTAPAVTRSMHVALADLGLERSYLVHVGAGACHGRRSSTPRALDPLPEELKPLR